MSCGFSPKRCQNKSTVYKHEGTFFVWTAVNCLETSKASLPVHTKSHSISDGHKLFEGSGAIHTKTLKCKLEMQLSLGQLCFLGLFLGHHWITEYMCKMYVHAHVYHSTISNHLHTHQQGVWLDSISTMGCYAVITTSNTSLSIYTWENVHDILLNEKKSRLSSRRVTMMRFVYMLHAHVRRKMWGDSVKSGLKHEL